MLKWDESLQVGIKVIDDQHKELLTRINNLIEAMTLGKGKAELEKTLDFLESYVKRHFSDEERLQKQHNYKDYEFHKGKHEELKSRFKYFKERLLTEGPNSTLVLQVQKEITTWYKTHILQLDKELAAFIQSKNKKE